MLLKLTESPSYMGFHRSRADGLVPDACSHDLAKANSSPGFPMAKNLRAKIPAEDVLFIQDINKAATSKFLEENPSGVRIADSVREIAEKSVRHVFMFANLS